MLTGVLSDADILNELKKGDASCVVIEPFNRSQLSNCSYDVTLGEYYYVEKEPEEDQYMCPWNPEHLTRMWHQKPIQAGVVADEEAAKRYGAKVGDKIILLKPGQNILAHTQEFIGGRYHVTSMMKARSSIGRCFFNVCSDAGWGDVSYTSRYTMEIRNNSHFTIVLVVGQKIGQIVFLWTGEILKSYEKDGSYQTVSATDMEAVKKAWKPSDMLPKLKRVEPTLPLPTDATDKETIAMPVVTPDTHYA